MLVMDKNMSFITLTKCCRKQLIKKNLKADFMQKFKVALQFYQKYYEITAKSIVNMKPGEIKGFHV